MNASAVSYPFINTTGSGHFCIYIHHGLRVEWLPPPNRSDSITFLSPNPLVELVSAFLNVFSIVAFLAVAARKKKSAEKSHHLLESVSLINTFHVWILRIFFAYLSIDLVVGILSGFGVFWAVIFGLVKTLQAIAILGTVAIYVQVGESQARCQCTSETVLAVKRRLVGPSPVSFAFRGSRTFVRYFLCGSTRQRLFEVNAVFCVRCCGSDAFQISFTDYQHEHTGTRKSSE